MLPNDTLKPSETSGLRIGFAAATTRGCRLGQAILIASLIHAYLSGSIDQKTAFVVINLLAIINQLVIINQPQCKLCLLNYHTISFIAPLPWHLCC